MKKTPKISYKVYPNTRLKPVWFHGSEIYPLYIVVVYNRTPTYFKSYYFDLLTHPKYAIQSVLGKIAPLTDEVLRKEQELLNHLVQKYSGNFNIETFKKDYLRLSRDLLFETEKGFQSYVNTFFQDQGLPALASLFTEGGKYVTSENLLYDLKAVLKTDTFNKFWENAAFYAPPYIPLCAFIRSRQKISIPLFSVLDWSSRATQEEFTRFLLSSYSDYDHELTQKYFKDLIFSFQQ